MLSKRKGVFVFAAILSLLMMSHSPLLQKSTIDFSEISGTSSVNSGVNELPPNGDYEEILVEFGADSIGDLYGLYIALHDPYGQQYQFWFDTSGSDYYDPETGIPIAIYDVEDISVVASRFSDAVNGLGSFESFSSGREVFIISTTKGDTTDSYTNAEGEELVISILKQGSHIRVHAMHEDIASFNYDALYDIRIAGLEDGSFILTGVLQDLSAGDLLGCSTGNEADPRRSIVLKVDYDGTCSWLRRVGGYNEGVGGGIKAVHAVDGGAIFYIHSSTHSRTGSDWEKIEGTIPTEILGSVFENTDLFAKINEDGVWIDAKACPQAPHYDFKCAEYSVSQDTIIVHDNPQWCSDRGASAHWWRIDLEGYATSPWSGSEYPRNIHSVSIGQDGEIYTINQVNSGGCYDLYIGAYNLNGEKLWQLDHYNQKYQDLGLQWKLRSSHSTCMNPEELMYEPLVGRNPYWSGSRELHRSFMMNNHSLVMSFAIPDEESTYHYDGDNDYPGIDGAWERCFMRIFILNTTSQQHYSVDTPSLPGFVQGKYATMIPRSGKNEVCFTNAGHWIGTSGAYGYLTQGSDHPAARGEGYNFSIACYDEEFQLDWDYSNNFPDDLSGSNSFYWDYSGPDIVVVRSSLENEYVLSRIVPPDRLDYDSDSILDLNDWCLGTGAEEPVDEKGCSWRQRDADSDTWSNGAESDCGTDPESSSSIPDDFDGDFECDLIDEDDDNDGARDEVDLFPYDELDWSDFDRDGIGDNADADDDNDGWSDVDELRCLTDHLDSSKKPVDIDEDGECDEVNPGAVGGGWSSESATSHCEFQDIGIYSDDQGCPVVFSTTKPDSKTSSNIVSVSTVPRGTNGVSEMVLSNDGNVLAILDPYQNLRIEFLNEPSSSYSMIISENDHLLLHPVTGRVSIVDDDSCLDVLTDLPCGEGWSEENQFASTRPHWTGSVYFSHEYTACKPGWTGWAHCGSGWYEVGEWNEYSSPSIQGLVSDMGGSEYCPGCSSPDGRYLADVVNIATDWELLGYVDARMDIIVSNTETWTSNSGVYEKPGGVATIIGGHLIDYCNSIVCLISEMSSSDDGMMFGFGGFAWSGDSGYLYAATSDSIITIDPERGISSEENNPYECGTPGGLSQLVGVSTPDGSTVVIPCGDDLLILTIDRSPSLGNWSAAFLVLVLLIAAGAVYWWKSSRGGGRKDSPAFLLVLILVAPVLSGCLGGAELDTDPISLPETIDISLQGGVADGDPILYIDVEGKVPPETIDVLVVTEDSHSWVSVTNIRYTTQYGLGGFCQDLCDVSVTAFYMGKSVKSEIIHFA